MNQGDTVACNCGNQVRFEFGVRRVKSSVMGQRLRGSERFVHTPIYCKQCGSPLHLQINVDGDVQVIAKDKAPI